MTFKNSKNDGVYLGISLASQYYSKERLRAYLSWASVNCRKFAFLIGDEIYAYTYSALNNCKLSEAYDLVKKIGDQTEKSLLNLAPTNTPTTIFRWDDLKTEEYYSIMKAVEDEYNSNIKFAMRVRSQVWKNLGNNLYAAGACKEAGCQRQACNLLDKYVLLEIPGLIIISEYLGYETEIYPGPDLSILSDFYKGNFSFINNFFPSPPKRKFMNLILNKEEI
jgi:tRNA-dependent cyclodipeptide synthase